jgi:hypothetical protein
MILVPILFVLLVLWVQPAMAYIVQGTDSAMTSVIIDFFIAISFVIKTNWHKIKSLFTGKSKGDNN